MHAFRDGGQWVAFTNQRLPLTDFQPALDPETGEPIEGQENAFWVPPTWSDDEKLERFGLHVVLQDAIPTGKRVVSEALIDDAGAPRLARTFEDVPQGVPDRVSARMFRLQLRAEDKKTPGFRAAVLAWVASQSEEVQDAFEYSDEFYRADAMMQAGFAALGFTEEQGDAFFLAASLL